VNVPLVVLSVESGPPTWALQFVSGIFGALLVLVGGLLAMRADRQRQDREFRYQEVTSQRRLIADAVISMRAWLDSQMLIVPLIAKADSSALDDLANASSVQRSADQREKAKKCLLEAQFLVNSKSLAPILAEIAGFIASYSDAVVGPLFGQGDEGDAAAEGLGKIAACVRLVESLEQQAIAEMQWP
jgi:hypothetical protein